MSSDNQPSNQPTLPDTISETMDVEVSWVSSMLNRNGNSVLPPYMTIPDVGLTANSAWANNTVRLYPSAYVSKYDVAPIAVVHLPSSESLNWEKAFVVDANLVGSWWMGHREHEKMFRSLVQYAFNNQLLVEDTRKMVHGLCLQVGELSDKIAIISNQSSLGLVAVGSVVTLAGPESSKRALDKIIVENDEELFDAIADGEIMAPNDVVDRSIAALNSESSSMRAAAARALSFVAPELAKQHLPAVIERETQKFAKSIIQGALRAAAL